MNFKRSLIILIALFTGGFVPIHVVVLSFGYAQYIRKVAMGPKVLQVAHTFGGPYTLFLYIPSLILLFVITLYCKHRYPGVYRRIVYGFAAGALATIGLDWIRQMGVINGWLPGDTPLMFGKVITGSPIFSRYYWVGQMAHFLNGADFGLCFAFFFARRSSRWRTVGTAIFWMLVIEFFMMVGPPMGPMVGLFGVRWMWPQLFALTFVAHVVHGTILGILCHQWLRPEDKQWILPFLLKGKD